MEIKIEELLQNPETIQKIETQCNVKLEYEIFKNSVEFFEKYFGKEAKCIFTEKSAYIVFKERTNILVIVNKDSGYNKEELCFANLDIEIIGTNKRKLPKFFTRLYNDIIDNKYAMIFFTILLVLICKIINTDVTCLKDLNDALINVISIFVGTLFVFITLFYEDENKIDIMIQKGKFDIDSENDKYIFDISLISLVGVLISNSLIEKQKNISFIFTLISVLLLVICFKSVTHYYLRKIKFNAINKQILSFKEEFEKNKK